MVIRLESSLFNPGGVHPGGRVKIKGNLHESAEL